MVPASIIHKSLEVPLTRRELLVWQRQWNEQCVGASAGRAANCVVDNPSDGHSRGLELSA